jgi:hypothetical protein
MNYNSGQTSAFGFGGYQVGWNGDISGSFYTGAVWGLNDMNTNYSNGFTAFNLGDGLGGFIASTSGGPTGGLNNLGVHPFAPGSVTAAGVSAGGSIFGGFTGGITATNYSKPLQLGKLVGFEIPDYLMLAARQLCK